MYETHPLADVFPMMTDDEIADLAADIAEHGQREPIVITGDNLILDGRNRYRACVQAGIAPTFDLYRGRPEDMAAFVVSLNLKRRHLNETQRAMVAAKLATLPVGGNQHSEGVPIGTASDLLNVGERSVKRAREVLNEGAPELVGAVEAGKIAVSAAADILDLPHEEQSRIAALEPEQIRAEVHYHRTNFSGDNEWYTPAQYVESAREVLGGFDLDPASCNFAQRTVRAASFFTKDDDGLQQEWRGRVWLNPPYAQPLIMHFVEKLVAEVDAGNVTDAVLLTHNYTDTQWFHLAESRATRICFTRGRIRFEKPDGTPAAPTQGQAFFYYGKNPDGFASVFAQHGFIR